MFKVNKGINKKETKMITATLDLELFRNVEGLAKTSGVTIAELTRQVLTHVINEQLGVKA